MLAEEPACCCCVYSCQGGCRSTGTASACRPGCMQSPAPAVAEAEAALACGLLMASQSLPTWLEADLAGLVVLKLGSRYAGQPAGRSFHM